MNRLLPLRSIAALALILFAGACITVEARPPVQQGDVAYNAEAAMDQLDRESAD